LLDVLELANFVLVGNDVINFLFQFYLVFMLMGDYFCCRCFMVCNDVIFTLNKNVGRHRLLWWNFYYVVSFVLKINFNGYRLETNKKCICLVIKNLFFFEILKS